MTLVHDPAVPRRNSLLRPLTMAGVLSQRLHGGVPVERCERMYVKYRVGESLRVVYRYAVDGEQRVAAARSGPRAAAPAVHAPEVGASLWPFPHDRKLAALPALAPGSRVLARLLGQPCASRLVAYAAEQSACAECRDARGQVIAFAKVQGGDDELRGCRALADQTTVRVPRVLAASHDVLILEALAGRRLDHLGGDELVRALQGLGKTLALLHTFVPLTPGTSGATPGVRGLAAAPGGEAVPPFVRLEPARLATAAEVISRARPDVADAAQRLLARLLDRAEPRPAVLLHGDVNLRNALQRPAAGGVALLDLEHLSTGPAAADLGQILAGLRGTAASALLAGYREVAPLPDRASLRWHTAASVLARVALPAVSRFRPRQLAQLGPLLEVHA